MRLNAAHGGRPRSRAVGTDGAVCYYQGDQYLTDVGGKAKRGSNYSRPATPPRRRNASTLALPACRHNSVFPLAHLCANRRGSHIILGGPPKLKKNTSIEPALSTCYQSCLPTRPPSHLRDSLKRLKTCLLNRFTPSTRSSPTKSNTSNRVISSWKSLRVSTMTRIATRHCSRTSKS